MICHELRVYVLFVLNFVLGLQYVLYSHTSFFKLISVFPFANLDFLV